MAELEAKEIIYVRTVDFTIEKSIIPVSSSVEPTELYGATQ